jgi:hypothetical protein
MAVCSDLSNEGLLLLVGGYPIRQRIFYEKDFCWVAMWELELEIL